MTYNIYSDNQLGVIEEVLDTDLGYYIGLETGTKYSKNEYSISEYIKTKIVNVDKVDNTGMYLIRTMCGGMENNYNNKIVFLGAIVSVRKYRLTGGVQVYYCKEINEYFSEYEIS